ncbi:MAG: DUF1385 domain-containing protein [Desulfovibrio sp.]|nr:DUF1385 domain-containing protein [Desulfovibrio sp.]
MHSAARIGYPTALFTFFAALPAAWANAACDDACDCRESLAVGGQAVIEGIMMRNGGTVSLAVRTSKGNIVALTGPRRSRFASGLARKRWLRGFPLLIDTMIDGIKALNLSASLAAESEGERLGNWQIALTLFGAVGFALVLFVVLPHLLTLGLNALSLSGAVEDLSFHLWDGLLKFILFIGYIACISCVPDIRRVFEYHGAEHKTIAAYEHGENPVTAGAAAARSRLHPRCGTTFLLIVLSLSIFMHAALVPLFLSLWTPESALLKHTVVILFKLLLMAPISALAYEAVRAAAGIRGFLPGLLARGPGMLLQLLTTREPDFLELEVALVALKEALGDTADAAVVTPPYERRNLRGFAPRKF